MNIATLSHIDPETHKRDFQAACQQYQNELTTLESGTCDVEEVAVVLQKLGDSYYACGHNLQATKTYERLLPLQQENGFSGKDLVLTQLKLAKAYDLCDNQEAAAAQFHMAYNLARLHMPSQHYLRRSVCASYSVWLAKSGRNPNLLANLQTELDIIGTTNQNSANIDLEPKTGYEQETTKTVADFSALLGKLNKQNAKKCSTKKRSVKRVSVAQAPPIGQALKPTEYPSDLEFVEYPVARKSNLQPMKPVESQFETASNCLVDSEPEAQPAGLNLRASRDVAMRKSSRSFFRDGSGSGANGSSRSAEVTEQGSTEPNTDRFDYDGLKRKVMALAPSTIITLMTVLIFKAVCGANVVNLPSFYSSLNGNRFATADGALSIRVRGKELTVNGRSMHRTVAPLIWYGSFSDEMRLLSGGYRNCVWLTPADKGLQDQSGRKFFSESAPELMTVSAMEKIAKHNVSILRPGIIRVQTTWEQINIATPSIRA